MLSMLEQVVQRNFEFLRGRADTRADTGLMILNCALVLDLRNVKVAHRNVTANTRVSARTRGGQITSHGCKRKYQKTEAWGVGGVYPANIMGPSSRRLPMRFARCGECFLQRGGGRGA